MQQEEYNKLVGKKITGIVCDEYDGYVFRIAILFEDGSRHTLDADTTGLGGAALFLDHVESD